MIRLGFKIILASWRQYKRPIWGNISCIHFVIFSMTIKIKIRLEERYLCVVSFLDSWFVREKLNKYVSKKGLNGQKFCLFYVDLMFKKQPDLLMRWKMSRDLWIWLDSSTSIISVALLIIIIIISLGVSHRQRHYHWSYILLLAYYVSK